jgi:hypothetical protein
VLGLLPLALGLGEGTEMLRPLGITVFAGLSLGTLLTLFVVPALYLALHDLFRWNLLGTRRQGEEAKPPELPASLEPKRRRPKRDRAGVP